MPRPGDARSACRIVRKVRWPRAARAEPLRVGQRENRIARRVQVGLQPRLLVVQIDRTEERLELRGEANRETIEAIVIFQPAKHDREEVIMAAVRDAVLGKNLVDDVRRHRHLIEGAPLWLVVQYDGVRGVDACRENRTGVRDATVQIQHVGKESTVLIAPAWESACGITNASPALPREPGSG